MYGNTRIIFLVV